MSARQRRTNDSRLAPPRASTTSTRSPARRPQLDSASGESGSAPVLECSIGIMAYNEEANIGQLLEALLHQHTTHCVIREIIVLASGCTDGTEAIVRDWARRHQSIKLLTQPRREGKASAVNSFLRNSRSEVLV